LNILKSIEQKIMSKRSVPHLSDISGSFYPKK